MIRLAVVGAGCLLGALVLSGANCGGNGSDAVSASDAATDAPLADAARAPDAASDAATMLSDSGAACVTPMDDGGTISDWPGWRRLTEFGQCCIVDGPLDVDASTAPLTWLPCADASSGCLELQAHGLRVFEVEVTRDRSSNQLQNLLIGYTFDTLKEKAEYDVYDFQSGAPLGAWRSDDGASSDCWSEAHAGGALATVLARTDSNQRLELAASGPRDLAQHPAPRVIAGSEINGVQWKGTSDTVYAFDLQPVGAVVRLPIAGGNYVIGKSPVPLHFDFVERDDVFALSEHGTAGWQQEYRVDADGSVVLYRAKPDRHVSAFRTDGTTMFWVESYGGSNPMTAPTVHEVWAAPYTRDPATLDSNAKKIATVNGGGYPPHTAVAFGGLYAVATQVYLAEIVRLSDGAIQELNVGVQSSITPAYVSDTELWAVVNVPGGGLPLRRLRLAAW